MINDYEAGLGSLWKSFIHFSDTENAKWRENTARGSG